MVYLVLANHSAAFWRLLLETPKLALIPRFSQTVSKDDVTFLIRIQVLNEENKVSTVVKVTNVLKQSRWFSQMLFRLLQYKKHIFRLRPRYIRSYKSETPPKPVPCGQDRITLKTFSSKYSLLTFKRSNIKFHL